MTYALKDIGEALQKERERRGLSQRAYAALTGATQPRVSKIENGEIDPRLSTLIEFARSLDHDLMLVPRQHVPAVNAIIKRQPLSYDQKTAQNAVRRLSTIVTVLRERFPDNDHLTKLAKTTRELSNFRLRRGDAQRISKIGDALKSIQATPALVNTLDIHANELRRIRNEIAHNVTEESSEPRPAYRLDEDDNE